MSANSGPGYRAHPEHRVETTRASVRVLIRFDGEVVADSEDVVKLEETDCDAVYYLPRLDVKMGRLGRTTHRTYCPFKGDASYFTLSNGRTAENAAWSYEQPYDEVRLIKDRLAFYPGRVDSIIIVHAPTP